MSQTGSYGETTSLWGLVSPTSGTNTLSVSAPSNDFNTMGVYSFSGVKQSLPTKTAHTTGNSSSASLTIAAPSIGSWLIDSLESEPIPTVGSLQTRDWYTQGSSNYMNGAGSHIVATTTATSTMRWSLSYGARWNEVAVALEPATQSGGSGATTTMHYIHADHLGSTHIVTSANGAIEEATDYYAYGAPRIDTKTNYSGESRKYIGQYYDTATALSYLNARYYDGTRGQFVSQDPVFWGKQNLSNPQSMNSYNYANGNPINRSDPSGLASLKGTTQEVLSHLKAQLQGAASALSSMASAQGRSQFFGNVASGASMVRSDPKGVASSIASGIAQGVSQHYSDLYYGDDATQDRALAAAILFWGSLAIPEGRLAALPDSALVVRGGGLANQAAARIDASIAKSAARGVNGFSVQCSASCTDIAQLGELGQHLRNGQVAVTTVGEIRQAGGSVYNTGFGTHATVFGLTGEQASPLFQNIFINPSK